MTEDINTHRAFTEISKIIERNTFKNLDNLSRKTFLMPILLELQEQGFLAGKKEAKEEIIKNIRKTL